MLLLSQIIFNGRELKCFLNVCPIDKTHQSAWKRAPYKVTGTSTKGKVFWFLSFKVLIFRKTNWDTYILTKEIRQ